MWGGSTFLAVEGDLSIFSALSLKVGRCYPTVVAIAGLVEGPRILPGLVAGVAFGMIALLMQRWGGEQ